MYGGVAQNATIPRFAQWSRSEKPAGLEGSRIVPRHLFHARYRSWNLSQSRYVLLKLGMVCLVRQSRYLVVYSSCHNPLFRLSCSYAIVRMLHCQVEDLCEVGLCIDRFSLTVNSKILLTHHTWSSEGNETNVESFSAASSKLTRIGRVQ